MSYTQKERLDYNIHRMFVCENMGLSINQYNYIRRLGDSLHKILIDNTNGLLAEEQYEKRFDEMTKKIEEKINEIGVGFYVYFQTDPRGATIYIDRKPIEPNNYTQSYCIY